MDTDSAVEKGEIPSTADGDPLSSAQDESSEHGIGITQIIDMHASKYQKTYMFISGVLERTRR